MRDLIGLLVAALLISNFICAQNISVGFTSPERNSNIPGEGVYSNTQSYFTLCYTWSGQKANPQNKWKFHITHDNGLFEDYWTDENQTSLPLTGNILNTNIYSIIMYEEDYLTHNYIQQSAKYTTWFNIQQTIYVANNFAAGVISVDGSNYSNGSTLHISPGQSLSISAVENQIDNQGYTRVYSMQANPHSFWRLTGAGITSTDRINNNFDYPAHSNENGVTITCYLRKICQISFNGPVTANNNYYFGNPVPVLEGDSVSVWALNRTSNDYMNQEFNSWGDGDTRNPRSFATSNNTYATINYRNINPNNGYRALTLSCSIGNPVTLNWNEHPNSGVSEYKIFRTIRQNGGPVGPEVQLLTVTRGTTTYTDNDFNISNLFYYQVSYDVRAYYQPTGSTSNPDFVSTYATIAPLVNSKGDGLSKLYPMEKEKPTEYAITNFPNPFNPSTKIEYQLPESGFVTIKIYDMLGKEIETLVSENKPAGYHLVNFNAGRLASGVYIYTFRVNNYVQTKKLLVMK